MMKVIFGVVVLFSGQAEIIFLKENKAQSMWVKV